MLRILATLLLCSTVLFGLLCKKYIFDGQLYNIKLGFWLNPCVTAKPYKFPQLKYVNLGLMQIVNPHFSECSQTYVQYAFGSINCYVCT